MAGAVSRFSEFVTVERGLGPEGRIAVVRFDRGDGLNALSPEAMRQLTAVARSFEDDGDTSRNANDECDGKQVLGTFDKFFDKCLFTDPCNDTNQYGSAEEQGRHFCHPPIQEYHATDHT